VSTGAEDDRSPRGQPHAPLADRLVPLLKRAQLRLADLISAALAPYGIDGREWAVLISLADEDPLSQRQVARRLGIDRTTMVALVDGLEVKGLVARRSHPDDRRKNVVELTPAGRDTLRAATRAGDDAERRFLSPLPEREARQLKDALRTLISAAEHGAP
jgi:DNA-binding MarR family transcriptional regulator